MSVPLNAIDPEAVSLRERRLFEHHLDLLAPVMDAIVTSTVPSIRASVTDKVLVSGGGPVDNMTAFLAAFDQSSQGRGTDAGGAARDAGFLWWEVIEYTRAVTAWLNVNIAAPYAPDLPPTWTHRVNPDPLTARAIAMTTAGWLIDRWHLIQPITALTPAMDDLFTEIRHMQGRYGVHQNPRRPRAHCATCGALTVVITWVDNPNGGPKPVKAGRCRNCGETYAEAPKPVSEPHTTAHTVLSHECDLLNHDECVSVHCECPCGHPPKEEPEMTQTPNHTDGSK